ncbi:HlyC/CorC family transporter [Waterburya agarophytonicola K14]|uniref:HlyC/CorC family transporter n=1 Tax=Waterburya agarophytonicola KI4 TaxID=2874699 RepID=A0A964BLJ4_9CYAN|nr:hemolysin family protein [Waterburya agarophytonicola]MCC0175609.1 HlyC/CorC family transporter [Waterburya agarophytonicola KI4]
MAEQNLLLTFIGVFLLIAINAFFVTAEFSIVSVRRSRISQLVKDGDLQAQTVQSLQRSIDRLLSTTQLGITLSSLALGWVGERTMATAIIALTKQLSLPDYLSQAIAHSFTLPLAFIILAYLQIVLGELFPKSVALMYPEKIARFFGPPSLAIARIFRPFVAILNLSTRLLLKLVGMEYNSQGWYEQLTSEELQLIIATEKESIGLEAEERQLLKNVFEFRDDTAEQAMIPRTDIKFLSLTTTFGELLETICESGYSGYPVIGDSLDDIRGIIHYKKLSKPLATGELNRDSIIEPWVEQVNFIPESTSLNELLPSMQQSHQKMVIVIDEFGGTSGLITLHDLVAEIVGDAGNDPDSGIEAIQKLDDRTFLVSAQMNLEEVNEQLELSLPVADDYNTLGGFLLEQWQKIPQQGEKLEYGDLGFTITVADSNRLYQVLIHC